MYQYLLFDLDGTLTDSRPGIVNSIMYALEQMGIKVEDPEELNPFIGPPLPESFREFYGMNPEECTKGVAFYRERYGTVGLFENSVYDGIEDLLKELKAQGKKLLVATSKPEVYSLQILKHFGIYDYFDFVAGATMDNSRSKKADVINYALEGMQVTDKSQAVMIGDRKQDIVGAQAMGLDSIGVAFGYGGVEELTQAGATYVAMTPAEVLKFV